jgi:hypothetical protein
MELKYFIKETLKDIVEGIEEAQKENNGGIIVPKISETLFSNAETGLTSYQKIDFEVEINAIEEKSGEVKLSVVTGLIGGHVKGKKNKFIGNTAKLSFNIPIKLPYGN